MFIYTVNSGFFERNLKVPVDLTPFNADYFTVCQGD
tara:strand:+ start:2939 stop:3046 length:108 start_codon:yes stop_codon:yes gene_type:complete